MFIGAFTHKHQDISIIGSDQLHLSIVLSFFEINLSKKSENIYSTFFEPVDFKKQGFKKWGDLLHHENPKKPLKYHLILPDFEAKK